MMTSYELMNQRIDAADFKGLSLPEISAIICDAISHGYRHGRAQPARAPYPMIFPDTGDERVCLACKGFGQISDAASDETDAVSYTCWQCLGAGTRP